MKRPPTASRGEELVSARAQLTLPRRVAVFTFLLHTPIHAALSLTHTHVTCQTESLSCHASVIGRPLPLESDVRLEMEIAPVLLQ